MRQEHIPALSSAAGCDRHLADYKARCRTPITWSSVRIADAFAEQGGKTTGAWLLEMTLGRYAEPSVKGSADIDWPDEALRGRLLTGTLKDARRALARAEGAGANGRAR